ncbi:MAG: hypothetical protein KY469_15585 [Actinobacteria bacterium]|nr:hypothetical protein [Actinomycetota bacterium]
MPARDPRFDRVSRPDPKSLPERDGAGKEALYTTSPEAPPTAPVTIHCERCGTQRALKVGDLLSLVRPPMFVNPMRDGGRVWARCPACEKRSWLRFRVAGTLGAYLNRPDPD